MCLCEWVFGAGYGLIILQASKLSFAQGTVKWEGLHSIFASLSQGLRLGGFIIHHWQVKVCKVTQAKNSTQGQCLTEIDVSKSLYLSPG